VTLLLLALLAAPIYKVEVDNTWVRVVREVIPPHEQIEAHVHPTSVIVWLTDSKQHKAGDVSYSLAGAHVEENPFDHPVEAIVIELKAGAPPASPSASPVTLDPVKIDPKYHKVVLDNARVRAIRTILEPGIKSPVHEHPHYVVVYLTELHTTMTLGDGREVDNPRHPGEVAWRDYMKHSTLNVGKQTAVEIQVELK
jgi:quercetin dioxygenase-like cupin family protein